MQDYKEQLNFRFFSFVQNYFFPKLNKAIKYWTTKNVLHVSSIMVLSKYFVVTPGFTFANQRKLSRKSPFIPFTISFIFANQHQMSRKWPFTILRITLSDQLIAVYNDTMKWKLVEITSAIFLKHPMTTNLI